MPDSPLAGRRRVAPLVLERVLQNDRLIVTASLLAVTALAWLYLRQMSLEMPGMSLVLGDLASMPLQPWDGAYFLMIFLMWIVMMVGMMLPTASPVILIFARAARQNPDSRHPLLRSYLFVLGYLLVWSAFSLAATAAQWRLETAALQVAGLGERGAMLGGMVLLATGAYQWTPLKESCLNHCRSPLEFISRHWRRGIPGAIQMGIVHGLYCLGCCWAIMALLFVGGVMNLLWIAAIMVFVLLEKLMPRGGPAGRLGGVLLMLAGIWMVLAGLRVP